MAMNEAGDADIFKEDGYCDQQLDTINVHADVQQERILFAMFEVTKIVCNVKNSLIYRTLFKSLINKSNQNL